MAGDERKHLMDITSQNHAARRKDRVSWSRLIDDHDRIAERCADLVAVLQRSDHDCAAASRKLLELAVLVAEHLGVEDEVIDLTALATEADYAPETVAAMAAELDALRREWRVFVANWLPTIDHGDWDEFRREAEAMLARLTYQVKRESTLLYDDALQAGTIATGAVDLH